MTIESPVLVLLRREITTGVSGQLRLVTERSAWSRDL